MPSVESGFRTEYQCDLNTNRSYIILANRMAFPTTKLLRDLKAMAARRILGPKPGAGRVDTCMVADFRLWLLLVEHDLNPADYDALFDRELERLLPRISDPTEQARLRGLIGTGWTNYIAAALRNAGFRDQASLQEKIHDVVVGLLVSPGGLFRDYDQTRHGPLDLRWKRLVANAVKNIAEKERNRRRFIPTVSIGQERGDDLPDRASAENDGKVIDDFRRLVRTRLGDLGLAVLDARLQGQETKSLVGRADLGSPGRFQVKTIVQKVKGLAREYAQRRGDPAFLREIERAIEREETTVAKRRTAMAARQGR